MPSNFAWQDNASVAPWNSPASFSIGYPTEGDIITNIHPTRPGRDWFQSIYDEFNAIIEYAGYGFDPTDTTQLATAIQTILHPTFELREDGSFELREDGTFELRN